MHAILLVNSHKASISAAPHVINSKILSGLIYHSSIRGLGALRRPRLLLGPCGRRGGQPSPFCFNVGRSGGWTCPASPMARLGGRPAEPRPVSAQERRLEVSAGPAGHSTRPPPPHNAEDGKEATDLPATTAGSDLTLRSAGRAPSPETKNGRVIYSYSYVKFYSLCIYVNCVLIPGV